jgi:hypothetical protein
MVNTGALLRRVWYQTTYDESVILENVSIIGVQPLDQIDVTVTMRHRPM